MRLTVTASCSSCAVGAPPARRGKMCPLLPQLAHPGELIYREGDPAGFGWYVIAGTVLLSRRGQRRTPPRERPPGTFVGLETLVAGSYLDTARAITEVTLCGGPRAALESWLGSLEAPARVALEATLRAECIDAGVDPRTRP